MIKNKESYKQYLKQDALALSIISRKKPKLFSDHIWKFQICMRKLEYLKSFTNWKKHFLIPLIVYYKFKYKNLSLKLGFSIPTGVFEEGLSIAHYGTIVVNPNAKVGKNCRIHEDVNIGATNGSEKAPQIGNNVFIATGAKIIGDITIADDVAIGANAVVVKSINEPGTTWGGVPAKKISSNSSRSNLSKYLFE